MEPVQEKVHERILRVVMETPPKDFHDSIRFIIGAMQSHKMGIANRTKKTIKGLVYDVYTASDAIDWMVSFYKLEDRDWAILLGNVLVEGKYLEVLEMFGNFKDDKKIRFIIVKPIYMYDIHVEKYVFQVSEFIRNEMDAKKNTKEKRSTVFMQFARDRLPSQMFRSKTAPQVVEVERDGRRLSVIKPVGEELRLQIAAMGLMEDNLSPGRGAMSPTRRKKERHVTLSPPRKSDEGEKERPVSPREKERPMSPRDKHLTVSMSPREKTPALGMSPREKHLTLALSSPRGERSEDTASVKFPSYPPPAPPSSSGAASAAVLASSPPNSLIVMPGSTPPGTTPISSAGSSTTLPPQLLTAPEVFESQPPPRPSIAASTAAQPQPTPFMEVVLPQRPVRAPPTRRAEPDASSSAPALGSSPISAALSSSVLAVAAESPSAPPTTDPAAMMSINPTFEHTNNTTFLQTKVPSPRPRVATPPSANNTSAVLSASTSSGSSTSNNSASNTPPGSVTVPSASVSTTADTAKSSAISVASAVGSPRSNEPARARPVTQADLDQLKSPEREREREHSDTASIAPSELSAIRKNPLQISPQMASSQYIKEVLGEAQDLVRMHRNGVTASFGPAEWQAFAGSSVELVQKLVTTMVSLHIEKKKRDEELRQLRKQQGSPADGRGRVNTPTDTSKVAVVSGTQSPVADRSDAREREREAALIAAKKKAMSARSQSDMLSKTDSRTRVRTDGAGGSPLARRALSPGREPPPAANQQQSSNGNGAGGAAADPSLESIARKRRAINDALGYDLFEAVRVKHSTINMVAASDSSRVNTVEQMLTENEFRVVFGMSKTGFAMLPQSKQQALVRELGL